jgi:hypothetical protein
VAWLTLRVWATALLPTRAELRTAALAGGIAFLALVVLAPAVTALLR